MSKNSLRGLIFLIVLFSSCASQPQSEKIESSVDSIQKIELAPTEAKDTLNCEHLIYQLVKSSSFSVDGLDRDKLNAVVNEVNDSIVSIKISYKDTTTDVVFGWLELDLRRKSLFDITIDPDNPKQVTFDSVVLNRIMGNCSFKP